jgi:hypothetical protein
MVAPVKRVALTAALGLAALISALPASAGEGVSAQGVVASLSARGISVQGAHHTVRCALGHRSPSLAGYAVGDRVQAQCRRSARHLVLARIRHIATPAESPSQAPPVRFGGAVTALSSTSISLHDGDRNLTCALGDSSPSTSGLKIGDHARVVCQNGVLVSWTPVTAADSAHVYEGTVTAFDSGSISVASGDHVYTCTLGDGSPSLAAVHVGDRVLVGCRVGTNLLVLLRPLAPAAPTPVDTTPPTNTTPPQPVTWTAGGTLTALTSTSLTVHNDEHGDTTCSLSDGSPHLGDYHLGDHVAVACTDGVLKQIEKL